VLTRSGAAVSTAAVLLLAGGLLADYPELALLGWGCVAALLVAAAWVLWGPPVLPVTRTVRPERVGLGEPAHGVIRVVNDTRRASPPLVAVESVNGTPVTLHLPRLAPGEHAEEPYLIPTGRRGVYTLGPLTVGQSDPLRLVKSGTEDRSCKTLHVHPLLHPISALPTGLSQDMDGADTSSALQGGVAFHGVRDYVAGDSWRLIHWPTSARTGTLVVRHNVVPNESHVVVVLDTSSSPYTEQTFEDAVSAAASVCAAASRAGFRLDLRTTADFATSRSGGLPRLLDRLAEVGRGTDEGLPRLARLRPPGQSALLVVVSGQLGADALGAVATVSSRFLLTALVRFVENPATQAAPVRGVHCVSAQDGAGFVAAWQQLVRR
jgi:uncharacterized protein (DUF58 family)